jgi:parallel beta-helix repeat protein
MGKITSVTRPLCRAVVVCGLVGGAMTALAPLAEASGGGTLYVNASTGHDTGTCRLSSQPCATISYALSVATPNATIRVAAGDYPQPLTITQPVMISGNGDGATGSSPTVIDPSTLASDTDSDNGLAQAPIIDILNTTGVALKGLDIKGDNAQGQFNSCAVDFVGVYYHNSSGSMDNVQVTGIELPSMLFGCQAGNAVFVRSDSGYTASVSMTGLRISSFQKNGIICRDEGTSCTVSHSDVTGIGPNAQIAPNGIEAYNVSSITISHSSVSDNSYTGGEADYQAAGLLILDVGTVSVTHCTLSDNDVNAYVGSDETGPSEGTWTISGNTVTGATDNVPGGSPGNGYGDGIDLDSTINGSVSISDNSVSGSAEYGIALTGASYATVSGNKVTGNASDGIYIGGPGGAATSSSSNAITSNRSTSNGGDGIHADTDSNNNTFSDNYTHQNGLYDLQDAGSSNSWSGNTCSPANDSRPAGLCS